MPQSCWTDNYNNYVCQNSAWDSTDRWILAGVVIGVSALLLLAFILFACITSRRRHKQGVKPYWGTQWAAPPAYTRNDPHPEAKELAESPAPSYQAATNGSSEGGERVVDGMNTTTNAAGDHSVAAPPRVADPAERRDHQDV